MRTGQQLDNHTTTDMTRRRKELALTFRYRTFNGRVPVTVLEFLTRYTEEADTNRLTELQAFLLLLFFLEGEAENQLRSNLYG